MPNITTEQIKAMKGKEKIVALTAYDYTFAKLLDEAGVDIILVGDSVGMVCCGDKDTKNVTIEQMTYHIKAVARGVKHALVVGDMPIHTFDDPKGTVKNARMFLNAGAKAVKVEEVGNIVGSVKALINEGIPVMGHVGLTPQTAENFKVRGKNKEEAEKILSDAKALDKAGIFSLVLECIPTQLAEEITKAVSAPTIGIGAGPSCDGQILVCYDLLGMFKDFYPKFVRHFWEGGDAVKEAVTQFRQTIETGDFPSHGESYT